MGRGEGETEKIPTGDNMDAKRICQYPGAFENNSKDEEKR